MRILVVTQYFWPENFRINDLVGDLVDRGHDVTILTGWPNYPSGVVFPEFAVAPREFLRYHGARVVRVPLLPRGSGAIRLVLNYISFAISASIVGPFLLRRCRFDVIFTYEPSPITIGIPAAVLRRLHRAPMALWVLDLWPETLEAMGIATSRLPRAFVRSLVRCIYDNCDLILGQSKGIAERIRAVAGVSSDVRYFPSWAESVFEREVTIPAPEIRPDPARFTIIFAGNVGDAQDFPAVLEAVGHLRARLPARWIIVGDGRRSPWLASEVQRRGLADDVLLLGRFPVERIPSLYAHADALLVSLRRDPVFALTIPGKVQSCLLAGVPLLAMLDGEGARIVEESGAGFACGAGDGRGLADAAYRLAALPRSSRLELGARGRMYAQVNFGRSRLFDQLEGWLSELAIHRSMRRLRVRSY